LNCKTLNLTKYKNPVKVDVVAFRGTENAGEVLQDLESVFTTKFVSKKNNYLGEVAR